MKVNFSKCPVCNESYGKLTTTEGNVEYVGCRCDHRLNSCIAINLYLVGIGFCLMVLIQVEKNTSWLKKVVDLLHNV